MEKSLNKQFRNLLCLLILIVAGISLNKNEVFGAHSHTWQYSYLHEGLAIGRWCTSCNYGDDYPFYVDASACSDVTVKATGAVASSKEGNVYTFWVHEFTTVKITTSGSNGYTYTATNQGSGSNMASGVGSISIEKYIKDWQSGGDTVHFIQLSATPNKYTVTYNGNGHTSGSTASNTATYNSNFLTTKNGFKKTGYTFNGWNEKKDGTGKVWGLSSSGVYEANKPWKWTYISGRTLYAQWKQNDYTVTYHSNGGSTASTTKIYHYNDSVDLSPTAEKNGKIFIGWNTDPNATKALNSFALPDLATSSNSDYKNDWELTLYAVYTIPVSDVANHTYPEYEKIKENEVYFRVWDANNPENMKIYQLTYEKDIVTMKYRYKLPTTDVASFVSGMASYGYDILAYDNAGNWRTLYKGNIDSPPPPVEYEQVVKHYRYDSVLGWSLFTETRKMVLKGLTFTPSYVTSPEGYKTHEIDEAYVVDGPKISSAYYMPMDYTLFFEANGGTCEVKQKTVTYNENYGELPVPKREGYSFEGWYTEQEGGTKISSAHKYLIADNSTLYAHWKIKEYNVIYDYWENGGTGVFLPADKVEYNADINLDVTAVKKGWEFVGWNTDAKALSGLDSMTMPAHEVTLYAIYKKDITLTIVEQTNSGQKISEETKTIYNTTPNAVFTILKPVEWTGWTFLGYTDGTQAMDFPVTGIGNEYKLSENRTLYGLYTSEVTLTYDTNGSSMVIEVPSKDRYYNASGNAFYPEFIVAEGPILSEHSFVNWNVESGTVLDENGQVLTTCTPGQTVTVSSDAVLKTVWDRHPKIEAYDRYFTLEQAKNGKITQAELLKKVKATDLEDGILVNGTDVIIKDYKMSDYTTLETDKELEITYQATDSFGNEVTKTVTVRITDTTMRESKKHRYVRFISPEFFKDKNGNLISESEGGLEESSIWRTDDGKRNLLERVLEKMKKKS